MSYTYLQIQEYLHLRTKVIEKLTESITNDDGSEIYRDAIIQRFEFTIEYSRKILKKILAYKGEDDNLFSKDVFRKFQALGLIDDINIWFDLINERNKLSHMYGEEIAEHAYILIKTHYRTFEILQSNISTYIYNTEKNA